MLKTGKPYTQIYNQYDKLLKRVHADSFKNFKSPLTYFVTYLHYLRDYHIHNSSTKDIEEGKDLPTVSLILALDAYEAFETCLHKYYVLENGVPTAKEGLTSEEAQKKFFEERNQHWQTFWRLVETNIESWAEE